MLEYSSSPDALYRAALAGRTVDLSRADFASYARLDVFAAAAAEHAAKAARRDGRSPAPRAGVAAGLVPFKTSRPDLPLMVNLAPSAVAERRVKRLKKSVWASGHLHGIADRGHRPPVCWFVTLTYAQADAWEPDHVSKSIERFRNWCRSIGVPCRYTWVAEIQPQRMARTGKAVVHYHLLAWLPHGVRMPQWDRKPTSRRALFWPHGMTNTEVAKSGVGYLMKYLSKLGELTRFPRGLRLYGIGGLTHEARQTRSWFNLPEWVKSSHGVGEICTRAGRFVVRVTGEVLAPAFAVRLVPSGLQLRALRELPARFHDGAYSTFPRVTA